MRIAGYLGALASVVTVSAAIFLVSCATTARPQQFRTFLLPPPPHAAVSEARPDPLPDPPPLGGDLYANAVPLTTTFLLDVPRPSDTDFLLKKADDRFLAGKQALQEGRFEDARKEFNLAVEILMSAPENSIDRPRVERRLEDLVETIYRYDLDQLTSTDPEDKVSYDKAPLEGILDMTFPVDPGLRTKVKEQIQATASQLPLEESDAVVGAINFFSTERGKKILIAGLRRSGRYKSLIERVLTEEGLPQELIFVAQEESGFLPRAMSNKACVGMWQFAKFRGKEYGLQQTAVSDDRMDPEKATRAAARHLHDLYEHFGDWYLALAAYDCGPGCVDHAVMRTGYADFWALRRLNVLPKETANYVPVILAMTIMAKNGKDYGLEGIEMDRPVEFETIELETPTHLGLVAEAVERPMSELKELNPALLRSVAPAGYALHVPKGMLPAVEAAFAVVPSSRRDSWRLHKAQTGDTFATLSKRYSAPLAMVSSANHDEVPEAGQWMAIPAAYPGDRTVHAAAATRHRTTTRKPVQKAAGVASSNAVVHRPAQSSAKAQPRKKSSVAHKGSGKTTHSGASPAS